MKIVNYQKCKCGAVTLFFDNGSDSSMRQETLRSLRIDLSNVEKLQDCYACNHCVNHYGVDLCDCGSGEPVGKCSCGSHTAMQQLGEKFDSLSRIIKNFSQYGNT